jgi:hypothetical protein
MHRVSKNIYKIARGLEEAAIIKNILRLSPAKLEFEKPTTYLEKGLDTSSSQCREQYVWLLSGLSAVQICNSFAEIIHWLGHWLPAACRAQHGNNICKKHTTEDCKLIGIDSR